MLRFSSRFVGSCISRNPSSRQLCKSSKWHTLTARQGPSWVQCMPSHIEKPARVRSRTLRLAGDYRSALQLLERSGTTQSQDPRDLVEYLLVQHSTDEYAGPRERLTAMQETIASANMERPRAAYNVLLAACAREAAKLSDNSSAKRDVVLEIAWKTWDEIIENNLLNRRAVSLMYTVCGECNELALARRIRRFLDAASFQTDETVVAAFMQCLGKCGRAAEAEQLYFSSESREYRGSDVMLTALFRAFVAANKITKAEALISMYGSSWLNINCCNIFVKQCAQLRMHDTAMNFVDRMTAGTQLPEPTATTYNLLLRGLSAGNGSEDRDVAADRAMSVVKKMKEQKIEPTTVTYNTLIRSLVFRNQIDEAMQLFQTMRAANHITFSHLMLGASKTDDIELAETLLTLLVKSGSRPNYGFCKSYLGVVARVLGVDRAFEEAEALSNKFAEVLMFGDVGSKEATRMALINACGSAGDLDAALKAVEAPLGSNNTSRGDLAPLYVSTVVMQVCLQCNAHGRALEVFKSMRAAGLKPNFEVYESLIYGLSSLVRRDADRREQEFNQGTELMDFSASFDSHYHNDGPSLPEQKLISLSVELLCEMHRNGVARSSRHAAFIYNTLIAASASIGNFELALQIFNKMCRQNNSGVVYIPHVEDSSEDGVSNVLESRDTLSAIASTGMFENSFHFPASTVGTYNSIIYAAWKCGHTGFCFEIFDVMRMDRTTEPNVATLSLLAEIVLEDGSSSSRNMTKVLKALDRMPFLSEDVSAKRIRLRQRLLALRWSQEKVGSGHQDWET